jgi:hypothetical protein
MIASDRLMLLDEFNAQGFSTTPDYFTVPPRSGIAGERKPQSGRQYVGIIDSDLGTRTGDIVHDALTRRETTFEGDPAGLAQ